ncbi:MAG: hypothetical protein ABJ000_17065 [Saccharospirillum sp.]
MTQPCAALAPFREPDQSRAEAPPSDKTPASLPDLRNNPSMN